MNRTQSILLVTRRLIILAIVSLLLVGSIFAITFLWNNRFMVSWVVFGCGLVGGFVSIQQRLRQIDNDELEILSRSWCQILLVPIYGAIFALVFYVLLLSSLVDGQLFPAFYVPPLPADNIPTTDYIKNVFLKTYPSTAEDFAKLLFWSFVAGFSERFVPQIIANLAASSSEPSGTGDHARAYDAP